MGKKISVKERLRRNQQAGRGQPTKTVPVYLGADMDLIEEYQRTVEQLDAEQPARGRRLGDATSTAAVEARLAELREQLDEFREDFTLRGLDDRRYERLVAGHPPRKTDGGEVNPRDQRAGWNVETFPVALVRACVVEPELDDEDWLALLGDDDEMGQLSSGQLDALAVAAMTLSRTHVDVPFWPAASTTTQSS